MKKQGESPLVSPLATPSLEPERPAIASSSGGKPASGEPTASGGIPNFIVRGEQGRGGLGIVLRAHDRRLGRVVAIKVLAARDEAKETRFLREARLTARLQHPSIVPVYEVGEAEDGAPYYAMKLIAGRTLAELVAAATKLDERIAFVPNVIAVADAIAYAHEQGILHRDLKPQNVVVGEFGETIVIDWGLAKDLRETEPGVVHAPPAPVGPHVGEGAALGDTVLDVHTTSRVRTVEGAILGTPAYMAPEQMAGAAVDERTDVFAVGALLYHLLAGVAPYADESGVLEALERARSATPVPLDQREPGVPEDLVAIVRKAMARVPADRYATAKELAADLRRFQTGQLVGAHKYSGATLARRWVKRNRAPLAVAGTFLAILLVTGALAVRRIVRERDTSETMRARADSARAQADSARGAVEANNRELTLLQARASLEHDPTASIAWLRRYPADGPRPDEVRAIAADAALRGVARHVLLGMKGGGGKAIAFSPDGSRVAAGDETHSIVLWDVASGKMLGRWEQPNGEFSLAYVGSTLVSGGENGSIVLVDTATSEARVFPYSSGHVEVMKVDDHRVVARAEDAVVSIWNVTTGASRVLVRGPTRTESFDVTPDGRTLVTTFGGGKVMITDLRTESTRTITLPFERPWVSISPDGTRVGVVTPDNGIHLCELGSGTCRKLGHHDKSVPGLAFSPDGRTIATASRDRTVRLWDVATGESHVLRGHTDDIETIAYAPDGSSVATTGVDSTVRVWSTRTYEARVFLGHSKIAERLAYSPDGKWLASTAQDKSVRVWPLETGDAEILRGHAADTTGFTFTRDGKTILTASFDHGVRVWDVARGVQTRAFAGHTDAVWRVWLSPDERLAVDTSFDHTLHVLDLETGASRTLAGHSYRVWDAAWADDGRAIVSASADGTARVWDVASGTTIHVIDHGAQLNSMSLSPDQSTIATAGSDGFVRLWERATGASVGAIHHGDVVQVVRFSPDGALVASASGDGAVKLWNARTGTLLHESHEHTARVRCLQFAPDGKRFVTGSQDGTGRVWDVATGESRVLYGHREYVMTCAFSPDGSLVATGGWDSKTRVWDAATGALRGVFAHDSYVNYVGFTPDGSRVVSSSWDATVRMFSLEEARLLPVKEEAFRAWLDRETTAVVDAEHPPATP